MGASTACPCPLNFTTSPFVTPNFRALAGLTSAALSQVNLVSGLGNFLQPAIVGETAIPNGGVGAQDDFDSAVRSAFAVAAAS